MINKLSDKILKFVKANFDFEDEMEEVYRYGIEITISSILNITLIIIAGHLIGDVIVALTFLLCFIPLRSYCGGYHATTYFRCNLIFLLTFLAVYFSSYFMYTHFTGGLVKIFEAILLLGFIPVLAFAPVRNPNKELDDFQVKKCRLISMIIYTAIGIASIYFVLEKQIYGAIIVMTLASVSVMIIIEIIMQRRGYHETENNSGKDDC